MKSEKKTIEKRTTAVVEVVEKSTAATGETERRMMLCETVELRIEGEGTARKLVGYAARFNKWSEDLGWFREKIEPGAFTQALKTSDVRALKNHDPNLILGRTKAGTLRLTENKSGLKFELDIPDTTTGRDTVEEVNRGDITGCSFAFSVVGEKWQYPDEGLDERTITQVGELFDVGPVTYPAYSDTTVAARSKGADKENLKRIADEKREAEPEPEKTDEEKEVERKAKFEEDHKIGCDYRKAERLMNRNRPADD